MKNSTASFEVDPQCTFTPLCPDELPIAGGHEIVGELNAQAQFAKFRVVSRDAHHPNAAWLATPEAPQFTPILHEPNLDVRWKPHAMIGTRGFDLIPGLDIKNYAYQALKGIELNKHPYGACYHDFLEKESTGIIEFLKQNSIARVIVGGLATDYCVRTTVFQLHRAGFEVILNKAACRGIAEESTQKAYGEFQAAGIRMLNSANDLI